MKQDLCCDPSCPPLCCALSRNSDCRLRRCSTKSAPGAQCLLSGRQFRREPVQPAWRALRSPNLASVTPRGNWRVCPDERGRAGEGSQKRGATQGCDTLWSKLAQFGHISIETGPTLVDSVQLLPSSTGFAQSWPEFSRLRPLSAKSRAWEATKFRWCQPELALAKSGAVPSFRS